MSVRIEIDTSAGFCFGVEKAIETAEKKLQEGELIFSLGNMVHNDEEIGRLTNLGLKIVDIADLSSVKEGKILFRAHGEPPTSYEMVSGQGLEIIDATCPVVLKLQQNIKKTFKELDQEREQIVIFGKEGHPESIGLLGQTENTAILVSNIGDLEKVDPWKNVYLFSQTTMDPEQFSELENILKMATQVNASRTLISSCTICNQMKRRKPQVKDFALKHDLILFVSGEKSSNGTILFNYCKSINPNSYKVEKTTDIDPKWMASAGSIGISGATSTSFRQLEEIKSKIESLISG